MERDVQLAVLAERYRDDLAVLVGAALERTMQSSPERLASRWNMWRASSFAPRGARVRAHGPNERLVRRLRRTSVAQERAAPA
jgi:hypothetical protein